MQQLDLFNQESGNKVAVIRARVKIKPEKKDETAKEIEPSLETPPAKDNQPQFIKPLTDTNNKPSKRGRKSLKENNPEVFLLNVPDDEILFQKQYYSIREVAGWFNMKPSLLRFWENEFDILKPRKNKKGDRLFRPEDVKNLCIIYQLLRRHKYSVEGAKKYLKENQDQAEMQVKLAETLTKFRSFLLELKANLGA